VSDLIINIRDKFELFSIEDFLGIKINNKKIQVRIANSIFFRGNLLTILSALISFQKVFDKSILFSILLFLLNSSVLYFKPVFEISQKP
jgi:hypothetical protein